MLQCLMSSVDFKKGPCGCVEFRGRGPSFNAGNRRILFVTRLNYLGIILDSEMTLEPLNNNVYSMLNRNFLCYGKCVDIYLT